MPHASQLGLVQVLEVASRPGLSEFALAGIVDGSGAFDSMIIDVVLCRRGARLVMPQIVAKLKASLTLSNIGRLKELLPVLESEKLVEQIAISDEQVIAQVKTRGSAAIYALRQDRQEVLLSKIRALVIAEPEAAEAVNLLGFLLDFDRGPSNADGPRPETIELATNWCLQFRNDAKIDSILHRLLWRKPIAKIISLSRERQAQADIHNKTFLLSGLLEAERKPNFKRVKKWFGEAERNNLDDFVVYSWLRASHGKGRAMEFAKAHLRTTVAPRWMVLSLMLERYQRSKHTYRWLGRFIKTRIGKKIIQSHMADIVRASPTKVNFELAKRVIKLAPIGDRCNIVNQLLAFTQDEELVAIAKCLVAESPDAPLSFRLVRRLCKIDPAFAVPWLADWAETALARQQYEAFVSILSVSSEPKYLEMARAVLFANDREGLPETFMGKANLLRQMLKHDQSPEFLAYIQAFLERQNHKIAEIKRLAKRCAEVLQP